MKHSLRRAVLALAGTALAGALLPASAQDAYPSRPIRLVVPFVAGGSADVLARKVAEGLSERLGQPFVIENRGGASGAIAAEAVTRAAPDGYTLLLAHTTGITVLPLLRKDLPYRPARDLAPISLIALTPQVLVVHPSGAKSLADYLDKARRNPGVHNYASGGVATPPHLTGELLKLQTGVDIVHVPYNGAPPALAAVVGNQIESAYANVDVLVARIKAGQLTGLAIAAERRSAYLPDLPTFEELGVSGVVNNTWFGLAAPAGVAPERLARLEAAAREVIESAAFQDFLAKQAAERAPTGAAAFARFLQTEDRKWADVLQRARIAL